MKPDLTAQRIFLLSPASCSGRRAEILLREEAEFELAKRLRTTNQVTLGEVFSFLSGLYFRGKLAYSSHFGRTFDGLDKALVITAGRGILSPEAPITHEDLRQFAAISIDLAEPRYTEPLKREVRRLAARLTAKCEVVLLGSIATDKYSAILSDGLKDHLHFPTEFIGRGDMSRGGLMLRCVDSGQELEYSRLTGARLRGQRPSKLSPRVQPSRSVNKV